MEPLHRAPLSPHLRVLLVEDEDVDTELLAHALEEGDGRLMTYRVADLEAARAYLRQEAPYAGAPTPHFVLLDLQLPDGSGFDVLRDMREARLPHVPVIVLSTSRTEADVAEAYRLGASAYIAKPRELSQLVHVVSSLQVFFWDVATLIDDENGLRCPT